MKYLVQEITAFTSTNLTEAIAEWSAVTTYAVGTEARVGTFIYKSVISSNLNFAPLDYIDIKWMKSGVSNKFAMLDLNANTKSSFTGDLTVTFTQNNITTLAIGNYEADTILVEVLDAHIRRVWLRSK